LQKVLIRHKKEFLTTNAEFPLISNPLKKWLKNAPKIDEIEIGVKFRVYDTHIDFLKKQMFFGSYYNFFKTLIASAEETAQKNG
jgi:hypothetical protein